MAISGTRSFNPDLIELLEEAYEEAGLECRTGDDIRTGKRSLNLLLLEWANKGLNLWTVDEESISSSLVLPGTFQYDVDIDTIAILDAVVRMGAGDQNRQNDTVMTEISASGYSQIANKLQRGKPSQFWFQRVGIRDVTTGVNQPGKLHIWPVPDAGNVYTIVYWRLRRMADAGRGATSTVEVPERLLPALLAGLALRIAKKKPAARAMIPDLRMDYDRLLGEAMEEDRERASLMIVPDLSGYDPTNG